MRNSNNLMVKSARSGLSNSKFIEKSLMASRDHVFLTWHDIYFTVPNSSQTKRESETFDATADRESLVDKHLVQLQKQMTSATSASGSIDLKDKTVFQDPKRKVVLHGLSGFAKPGQILAIMGASGSGKTSLLNIFGQRHGLSVGSKMTGAVKCNDRQLQKNDFGKFGAFVQQDDVLLETFNPEECFKFAAKLRTSLSNREIAIKVKDIINRLGL